MRVQEELPASRYIEIQNEILPYFFFSRPIIALKSFLGRCQQKINAGLCSLPSFLGLLMHYQRFGNYAKFKFCISSG